MARTEPANPEAIEAVARQVGKILGYRADRWGAPIRAATLHETFRIWRLDRTLAAAAPPPARIAEVATPTDEWHHQLRSDAGEWLYARSIGLARGDANDSVPRVSSAHVASRIAEAIAFIDDAVPDDLVTHLLVAPLLDIEALWIVGEARLNDRLVVVERPDRSAALDYRQFYEGSRFLERLRSYAPAGVAIRP